MSVYMMINRVFTATGYERIEQKDSVFIILLNRVMKFNIKTINYLQKIYVIAITVFYFFGVKNE